MGPETVEVAMRRRRVIQCAWLAVLVCVGNVPEMPTVSLTDRVHLLVSVATLILIGVDVIHEWVVLDRISRRIETLERRRNQDSPGRPVA